MKVGDKVKVTRTENSFFHRVQWWPLGDVTGTIEKVCKNGKIRVACDQFRNTSNDGRVSKYFEPQDVTIEVID